MSTYIRVLLFSDEMLLNNVQYNLLEELLSRREQGEPIAYIIGNCEFWSLKLRVSPVTIIPRPDTECLVEKALELSLSQEYAKVLDLGTGTGAISLALAYERPLWMITGIDLLPTAIKLARYNAAILGLNNVQFYESNWFSSLEMRNYNLIVSNPPYVKSNDHHLLFGDVRYEPHIALVAGIDGLTCLTEIIKQASKYLISNGWLLIEHGSTQGAKVRELFTIAGFINITTSYDYAKLERVTQGQFVL